MSERFLTEVDQIIRARYPLLYVVTWEEDRARKLLGMVAVKQQKALLEWSVTDGLRTVISAKQQGGDTGPKRQRDALAMLNEILQTEQPGIYVLKDFHVYMETPEIVRQLRDLAHALRQTHKTIVLLSPTLKLPVELEKSASVLDLPLPGYEELSELLHERVANPKVSRQFRINLNAGERDALIRAAQGMTLAEAENAFARAIVRDNVLDAGDIEVVMQEKMQTIRKTGVLEYIEGHEGYEGVGGMDLLKEWLGKRVRAFTREARDYGLPEPRGLMLLGVQGCGKSLVAKTIASAWQLPLLRMDISRIYHAYIGSSEDNMRRALRVAETLAPVVLWIDEAEKAFSGSGSSASADGGTTERVVGQFLTWMQERTAPVFVVMTANSIDRLPPELLRKGRLDEIFFVDLPRGRERAEIFRIHLNKVRRDHKNFDLRELVKASDGFSGSEIEQAIISAMHDSFAETRDVATGDILKAIQETVPLSRTMREDIARIRTWAGDRARPVSSVQARKAIGPSAMPPLEAD